MKLRHLITITLLCLGASAVKAQSATFNAADSSITYLKNKFKPGQEVQLLYGSGSDKKFEFIEADNYSNFKIKKFDAGVSKNKFIINSTMVNSDGKCILKGKASWTDEPDDVIIVYVEGAIDNKEIVAPNNIVATVKKPVAKKHH